MKSRGYTLLLLTSYFAISHMDRNIITITLEPIRKEFGLNDIQLGLLSGLAFAMFFSLMILPFAVLATRVNRRKLIAGTIGVWSLLTMLTGLSQSYIHLILMRFGVGIGEAGALPASHAVLTEQYPSDKQATAMSIFMSGANIGLALALIVGGYMTQNYGWRIAMFTAGFPGLILAFIIRFTLPLKEPSTRRISSELSTHSRRIIPDTMTMIWNDMSLRYILLGAIFTSITIFGIGAWLPSFLVRNHGFDLVNVGFYVAVVVGVFGMVGVQLVGRISDHFARRSAGWIVWVPALVILLTKPFSIFGLLAQQPQTAMLLLAVPAAFGATYMASTISVLHAKVPAQNKTVASALLLLLINLIGMGLGPLVVGVVSDFWRSAGYAGTPLAAGLIFVQVFGLIGSGFYIYAGRCMDKP